MCATASAASAVFTVIRTSSDPARARDFTCCAVPSTSAVSVFVMDCTTIGAVPPTRMGPMDTWTDLRRWMDDMVPAGEKRFLGSDILHGMIAAPHNRSVGESPATAGTPKAQAPPGNAQAPVRQIAGALESGGRFGGHPPKGRGAAGARSLRSPDRGRQRHPVPAVLYWTPEGL